MPRVASGLTRQQEQQYIQRTVTRLSRKAEPSIKREVQRAMREIASYQGNTGKQAEAQAKHKVNIQKILTKLYSRSWQAFGSRLLKALDNTKDAGLPKTDIFDNARFDWIFQHGGYQAQLISGTTYEQTINIIQEAAAEGVMEGLSENQIAQLIQEAVNDQSASMSVLRSRVIARTETHAASQASSHAAAKASGQTIMKEWVTAGSRARDAHIRADGQQVNLNEPFIVDGERLMYPSDSSGSAANVINCRCISVHIVT